MPPLFHRAAIIIEIRHMQCSLTHCVVGYNPTKPETRKHSQNANAHQLTIYRALNGSDILLWSPYG